MMFDDDCDVDSIERRFEGDDEEERKNLSAKAQSQRAFGGTKGILTSPEELCF